MNLQNHRQCPAGGFSFSGRSAMLRSLVGEGIRTGLLTGSGHPSLRHFSFSPSSQCPPNVLRCKMPLVFASLRQRVVGLNFALSLVVHLPQNKSASLREGGCLREAEFAAWRPKMSNWRLNSERGEFCLRPALRLARDTEARASCVSVCRRRLAGRYKNRCRSCNRCVPCGLMSACISKKLGELLPRHDLRGVRPRRRQDSTRKFDLAPRCTKPVSPRFTITR